MSYQKTKCATVTPQLLDMVGIPRRYHNLSVDFYREPELRAHLKKLLGKVTEYMDVGENFLVLGTFATGKTGFACQMLQEALAYGARVYFVKCQDLYNIWISKRDYDEESGTSYKDRILKSDLLVLDDFEPDGIDSRQQELMTYIVKSRYENKRATILTTIADWPQLKTCRVRMLNIISRSYLALMFKTPLVGAKTPNV